VQQEGRESLGGNLAPEEVDISSVGDEQGWRSERARLAAWQAQQAVSTATVRTQPLSILVIGPIQARLSSAMTAGSEAVCRVCLARQCTGVGAEGRDPDPPTYVQLK
jgi:hypothetical protein